MHKEVEHRMARIADFDTHFIAAGNGEPLILVHGIGSSIIPWHYNIGVFAEHFRVYAMDLPGHGLSEKVADPRRYTVEEAVRFLYEFCDTLKPDKVNIIGRSMGGLLVLAFALKHPEKVKKAIIAASGGLGRELGSFLRILSLPVIGEIVGRPTYKNILRTWEYLFYDKKLVPKDLMQEDYEIQNLPGNQEAFFKILRYGIDIFGQRKHIILVDQLHNIHVPVLILWGRNDRLIPVSHAYKAARLLPNASLAVLDGCGHFPQIEKKDEFHDVTLRFLLGPT